MSRSAAFMRGRSNAGVLGCTHGRFDGVHKRFDAVTRELADLRERIARLEGFLAGRRDRDAA